MEKVHAVCCACLGFAPILREKYIQLLSLSLSSVKLKLSVGMCLTNFQKGSVGFWKGFFDTFFFQFKDYHLS